MKKSNDQSDNISGLYQSLMQHKIHQDTLLWSKIQYVIAIQVGVLSGGFALHYVWQHSIFGGVLLLIGGLLTFWLLLLVIMDNADMKVNDRIIKQLEKRLKPKNVKGQVNWIDPNVWPRRFLYGFLRAHHLFYAVIILLVAVDFSLGTILVRWPSIFSGAAGYLIKHPLLHIPHCPYSTHRFSPRAIM